MLLRSFYFEAQRDVETSWDQSIRINWFWIEAKQQRHRAPRLDRHRYFGLDIFSDPCIATLKVEEGLIDERFVPNIRLG